ncbi:AHH domain-containing protein [Paenibacillus alba]|uniref:AHH domain-containing protein n=1 Tax=Paenibacillus alba TaxID=1197127 RepID=UPI00156375D5|nr:AHH domain-containing protein [Paenibacillus alba]
MYTYGWNNPTKYNDKTGHNPAVIAAAEGVAFLFDLAYTSWFATHPPKSIVTETPYDGESGINITITPIEQQSTSVTQTTFGAQQATLITTPFEDQSMTVIQQPVIDSSPYILASSNSALLRSNLVGAGYSEPTYTNAAHHIVAANDPRAASAVGILRKYGVNIDSADNGVFLPTSDGYVESNHRRIHTNVYYDNVNNLLQKSKSKEDVLDILDNIRTDLQNGAFPVK